MKGFDSEESEPISIFMAGAPGAGKTEISIQLLNILDQDNMSEDLVKQAKQHSVTNLDPQKMKSILRIDADELRDHFKQCGYTGHNSHLFQKAVSKLVHKIHDKAFKFFKVDIERIGDHISEKYDEEEILRLAKLAEREGFEPSMRL